LQPLKTVSIGDSKTLI